jgi:hypothetical protein
LFGGKNNLVVIHPGATQSKEDENRVNSLIDLAKASSKTVATNNIFLHQ